jgi:preprotein translocase subunit SecG
MGAFFGILLFVLAVFLILLVLVQRGRGGGLTGALGGMGGSSAFGAKAGDIFTRITIGTAAVWILVCVAAVYWATNRADVFGNPGEAPGIPEPVNPALPGQPATAPAGTSDGTTAAAPAGAAPAAAATSDTAPADKPPADADP